MTTHPRPLSQDDDFILVIPDDGVRIRNGRAVSSPTKPIVPEALQIRDLPALIRADPSTENIPSTPTFGPGDSQPPTLSETPGKPSLTTGDSQPPTLSAHACLPSRLPLDLRQLPAEWHPNPPFWTEGTSSASSEGVGSLPCSPETPSDGGLTCLSEVRGPSSPETPSSEGGLTCASVGAMEARDHKGGAEGAEDGDGGRGAESGNETGSPETCDDKEGVKRTDIALSASSGSNYSTESASAYCPESGDAPNNGGKSDSATLIGAETQERMPETTGDAGAGVDEETPGEESEIPVTWREALKVEGASEDKAEAANVQDGETSKIDALPKVTGTETESRVDQEVNKAEEGSKHPESTAADCGSIPGTPKAKKLWSAVKNSPLKGRKPKEEGRRRCWIQ